MILNGVLIMADNNVQLNEPIAVYDTDTVVSSKGLVIDNQLYTAIAFGNEYELPGHFVGPSREAPVVY